MPDNRSTKTIDSAARIAQLEAQVAELTAVAKGNQFATEIGNVLVVAATAGIISCPIAGDKLLKMIVDTAAHVLSAQAASLLLIDAGKTALLFEVATGPVAEKIKKAKVPIGAGIAGYVAASGQPMAVADAQKSSAHAKEIADRVGYHPQSILCVPLFYRDTVTGVLEVMDKSSGETFNQSDIDILSAFADQAAVAIELSRVSENLALLAGALLESIPGEVAAGKPVGVPARLEALGLALDSDPAHRRAMELAALVHTIASSGDLAASSCLTILRALAECLPKRPGSSGP